MGLKASSEVEGRCKVSCDSRSEDVDILIKSRLPISGCLSYVFLNIEIGPLSDVNEISLYCSPCRSSLGWGAGASYIDSMVAVS